jgi:hypothetical protein
MTDDRLSFSKDIASGGGYEGYEKQARPELRDRSKAVMHAFIPIAR